MSELKKMVRWLRILYGLQMVLLVLISIILTRRVFAIAGRVRDSLYDSGVAGTQVDNVNQAFASITHELSMIALAGMILTSAGFGLLIRIAKKSWPTPDQSSGGRGEY